MEDSFDAGSEVSPFFRFVAKEFHARGTPLRKKLASKEHGGALAGELGLHSASTILISDTPDVFSLPALPQKFVLKYAHGWSSRGVMLLEADPDNEARFEHLSQRLLTPAEIIERQLEVADSFAGKPNQWIAEEWLTPATPGAIPFDYKFYTFRSRVGLIIQIDRNTFPVKVALFDGEFNPLRVGVDFKFTSPRAQPGQHVIPKHPLQLLHWASLLSQQTDSPFVSIDLFDTPSGPAFGEFTFSPGGLHKRMWTLTGEVITMLDAHFRQESSSEPDWSWRSHGGASALNSSHLADVNESRLKEAEYIPFGLYSKWSQYLYNGGGRGATRASEYFSGRAATTEREWEATAASSLAKAWSVLPVSRVDDAD